MKTGFRLNNTTDFILNKKWLYRFTPNYPVEILSSQFPRHQAVLVHASLKYQARPALYSVPEIQSGNRVKISNFYFGLYQRN